MRVRGLDSALFGDFQTPESYARVEQMVKISVQSGTFLYDGRILFVAGFCKLWNGVFELWMIPSVYAPSAPVFFVRTLKRYITAIARDFKAHRMQTTSFDDDFHEKWMGVLGFQKEGTLRAFTESKQTMCQYGRLF
jgi:hypothetical protein